MQRAVKLLRLNSRWGGKGNRPFVMAVFLAIGLILADMWVFGGRAHGEAGILGGPNESNSPPENGAQGSGFPAALLGQVAVNEEAVASLQKTFENNASEESVRQGAVESTGSFLGSSAVGGGVFVYAVKRGDTLSRIAANFGISVQTILSSNPELTARSLRIGQELKILPVSGILYTAKEDETAESIAASFGLTISQLQEFNRSASIASIQPGMTLVIPGATPRGGAHSSDAGLPDLKGYFILPTDGFNWGRLHDHNAVDIAASCGTPVVASAEGLVTDASEDSWSGGYGHYVFIEHPNGTKTRYAHLDKVFVSVGDYVKQKDQIGTMGQTGDATGCHVHFEVLGAKNPFAK